MIENLPIPSIDRVMEVTDFKDVAIAKAAIETLKWLDRGAPEKWEGLYGVFSFNMQKFMGCYVKDGKIDNCGTVCCIAGAMNSYLNKSEIHFSIDVRTDMMMLFNAAAKDQNKKLRALFYPQDPRLTNPDIYQATVEQASETFRRYLFTGEVEWKFT